MNRLLILATAITLFTAPAFAQSSSVGFTVVADMPTIKDTTKQDSFDVVLDDAQVQTAIKLQCTAGRTDFGIIRKDKICAFQNGSVGAIKHPQSGKLLPRTQYLGSYTVTADGTTDARNMTINYLTLGTVAASSAQFGGSLNLKPELTSSGATGLKDLVLAKIGQGPDGLTNSAVDTVDFNRFYVPSAGLPSDKGCTWNGNAIFAYQTFSWFIDITADCGSGKTYQLKGNMPFTDSPGVEGQTQYDLTLTLPNATAVGDDALFADNSGGDLFATADGISGQIIMKNSAYVDAIIDGTAVPTATKVDGTGSLTGSNIPVDVVRSFATIIGLLSSTFFGA